MESCTKTGILNLTYNPVVLLQHHTWETGKTCEPTYLLNTRACHNILCSIISTDISISNLGII